jgi:peptidoglycan-associated lipoprotein
VKKTEEEEKRMEELLLALDAETAAEEPELEPEPAPIVGLFGKGVETESKAQPEKETIEIIKPDDNIIEKGLKSLKNLLIPSKKKQQDPPPEIVAVIVSPKEEPSPTMFMPESPLALQSANRLIPCKKIPEKMEVIYQRLQKTKGLNIADRRLRDRDNDRLMPVVHFDFDQIIIKPDYKKLLQQQASCVMKALGSRGDMIVQIEGHADERGSDEYNMALGHRRANVISNAIMAYLPDSKLARIFSYGEEFPLDRQSSSSAWAKNRRVEFTLLLKP